MRLTAPSDPATSRKPLAFHLLSVVMSTILPRIRERKTHNSQTIVLCGRGHIIAFTYGSCPDVASSELHHLNTYT